MYSKCGALEKAREVFEQLPHQNIVSWNAMITGYVQNGLGYEALKHFERLQSSKIRPDAVTYICALRACGMVGSLEVGNDIDTEVRQQGLIPKDILLSTTLIDMYSKCSVMWKAQEVFEHLPVRTVTSWSALIAGYAQLGQANIALDLYRRMRSEGIFPNSVTFIVLLNACSHAGLVKEGEKLFDEMCLHYHLSPTLEHYTCMINLFGRAGHFEKVKLLLDKVSDLDHLLLVLTILGACKEWKNVELGRWAFDKCMHLDENCVGAYICMQNLYLSEGMHQEADGIEALRVKTVLREDPDLLVDRPT
jgi:pentatricopeptide repeat protein